ncbi:MAG: glycosyltransferase [Bdellovibrionaceae bacterium]|nr:glycosyltransferase [Bdellovibrio sp.]
MKLSIIIPTLNEVKNVPLVFKLIEDAVRLVPTEHEIIFVDDQSNDGTIETIETAVRKNNNIHLVKSPQRKGLGHALKLGVARSKADLVLFLDCDVSIQAEDLVKLLREAHADKMVIGSRYIAGGQVIGAPKLKVFISKCLNWTISKYLSIPAIDISHSLRVFPAKKIKMPASDTHPAFFWELSIIGHLSNLKIQEVPITFRERLFGVSKNKAKAMLYSVIRGIKTVLKLKNVTR